MKRYILPGFVMAVLTFCAGKTAAFEVPEVVIEEKCAADWPDNYRMRAACIEQQQRVLNKSLSTPADAGLPPEDQTLVREKCAHEWPEDFRKRRVCEQKQIQGFQRLQSPPPKGVTLRDYAAAMASCVKEWPDDFRLRAHCLDEHLASVRKAEEADSRFERSSLDATGLP
jgi:hypothetical protein